MKKYFILSSILSMLLIGDCLAAQIADESRAIVNSPVLAEVFKTSGRWLRNIPEESTHW